MNNTIVIPTGYMGSGSSAVTCLVSELNGFIAPNSSFEYVFLHCPDGLFDLEDKLLYNNTSLRSDEAIHRFKVMMRNLYDLKYFWPGSYKTLVSKDFYNYVIDFLNDISITSYDSSYWYYQEIPTGIKMKIFVLFRHILKKIFPNSLNGNIPLSYKTMNISFPSYDEFFNASQKFLKRVFNDLGLAHNNIVLDQLLLPHNLSRIDRYFDQNVRVIVVDRDPRDVFILNKYYWAKSGVPVPYPLDVNCFVEYYRKLRLSEPCISHKQILRIHFEDLIYKYKETTDKIFSFIGSDVSNHNPRAEFDPDVSINNTQVYNSNSSYSQEVEVIQINLKEYLYPFPYIFNNQNNDSIF